MSDKFRKKVPTFWVLSLSFFALSFFPNIPKKPALSTPSPDLGFKGSSLRVEHFLTMISSHQRHQNRAHSYVSWV